MERVTEIGTVCEYYLHVRVWRGPVYRALKWNEILSLLFLSSGLWLNRSSDKGQVKPLHTGNGFTHHSWIMHKIWTCHSRKGTVVTNNINDGSVTFVVYFPGLSHSGHFHLSYTGVTNNIKMKISAVRNPYPLFSGGVFSTLKSAATVQYPGINSSSCFVAPGRSIPNSQHASCLLGGKENPCERGNNSIKPC